jgi:hypothetical protein
VIDLPKVSQRFFHYVSSSDKIKLILTDGFLGQLIIALVGANENGPRNHSTQSKPILHSR